MASTARPGPPVDAMNTREEIAEAVQYGRMTPDEAEAKLKDLGLPPLAPQPDPADYNPMSQEWWTLSMAVAWIAWRRSSEVRQAWDTFRREGSFWVHESWRIGVDGPVHRGWTNKPLAPASLSLLQLTEIHQRHEGTFPIDGRSIADSKHALWKALQAGALQGFGRPSAAEPPIPVPEHEWQNLSAVEERERDVVRHGERHGFSKHGYEELSFRRREIIAIWPPSRMEQWGLSLPRTMPPDGPGYMPLYCAAQWIVTRGGTRDVEPTHTTAWEQAFAELLAHIASDQVTVTGVRNGAREKLAGYLFASIAIDYPFADTWSELSFRDDLHLQTCVYIDDEHWRNGFDDCLRDRTGLRWAQLMVPKTDVARWWPFEEEREPPETHSGAPGRPSGMHLIEAEYDARRKRGEARGTLRAIAAELAEWGRTSHSTLKMPTARTIENALRPKHPKATK